MLSETVLPELEENLVESFVMTPQDFQDRLLSYKGAAFGLEPLLTQSAWFRPHNRSEEIDGLYMVGALALILVQVYLGCCLLLKL